MIILKKLSVALVIAMCSLSVSAQKHVSKNNIDTLVNSYMAIKNALVANNGTQAHYKANEMFNILRSQPTKGLTNDQQKIIVNYLDVLLDDCRAINETTDTDGQRGHFATLSKNLYGLLKALKATPFPIYQQYCPMKKAFWLSKSKVIANPYYNDYSKMLNCGKVTETLAPTR